MPACFLISVTAADSQGNTNQLLNSVEGLVTSRNDPDPITGGPTETYYVLNGTTVRALVFVGIAQGVPAAVRATTKRLIGLYKHAEYGGAGAPSTHQAILDDLKNYCAQDAGQGAAYYRPGQTIPAVTGPALLALFKPLSEVVLT